MSKVTADVGVAFTSAADTMDDMILSAWELLILGVGTVYVFLALLVLAVTFMSRALARFPDAPVLAAAGDASRAPRGGVTPSAVPAHHRRAIELAMAEHCRRNPR